MTRGEFGDLRKFDEVDATAEADRFISFLEWTDSRPDIIARRRRSYELLQVEKDSRIADVGSGLGTVVGELVALGAKGIGIDSSREMVERAKQRVPAGEFQIADVGSLPLDDDSIDGYRAERLYQHLDDPASALGEAHRVLRAGGRIVIVDQDWDAFVIDADGRELTRTILRSFADSLVDGWSGRRARGLLVAAGFEDVQVEVDTVPLDYAYAEPFLPSLVAPAVQSGAVTEQAASEWSEELRRRGEQGRFFAAMSHFVTSGTASD